MRTRTLATVAASAAGVLLAGACSAGSGSSGSSSVINWWTWDPNQAAAYQTCAAAVEKADPGTTAMSGCGSDASSSATGRWTRTRQPGPKAARKASRASSMAVE